MRYALNIPPFADAATVVGWARDAEQAGWDGVFLWDHVQWRADVSLLDPWVMLGAMAQVTERVLLGPLVTPLSRRRPYVVAKQLTTLDHLSGGRAMLGVGLGAPDDKDFGDLGEVVDPRVRASMLDEALTLIDGLLRGPVDHSGEHYRIAADLLPRPVRQPRPPIWVGGVAPHRRPLARAARWDGLVPIGKDGALTPDELAEHLARMDTPPGEGWDVVVPRRPGVPVQEYADAGATWLVHDPRPTGEWVPELTDVVRGGPEAW